MGQYVRRYATILLAVLGLLVLWAAACQAEIPLVRVGDAKSTPNRAYVRVQGVVARCPAYDPLAERLTFWVDDGTGQVLVVLNQSEHQALLESDQVPTVGDRVRVAGALRVQRIEAHEDLVSLTLSVPEHLEIEHPSPLESSIAEVVDGAADALYRKVLVRGQVREVWQPYEGVTILRLQDRTGEIDVVYDQNLECTGGVPITVFAGDSISVRGAVTRHRGQPQIVPDAASALQRLPPGTALPPRVSQDPTATLTPVPALPTLTVSMAVPRPTATVTATYDSVGRADPGRREPGADAARLVQTGLLSEQLLGRTVTIEARIEQARLLSAGCRSIVDDGSGPVVVWMPNALYGQLVDPEGWNVGGVVRVTGRVSEYEGELEVVPQNADEIVTVQRALYVTVPDVQIGNLGADDLGRRVTVDAAIVTVEPFSAGIKYLLDDGSGQVILLLWQEVFEAFPDKGGLAVGARVRVSGWVDEYRGELEVIPGLAYDVVILEGTGAP